MINRINVSAETPINDAIKQWHPKGYYPTHCDYIECGLELNQEDLNVVTLDQGERHAFIHEECAVRILYRYFGNRLF